MICQTESAISTSAPIATGPITNVSRCSKKSESNTSAGNRKTAICATEFLITEIARSLWPFAASVMPTTFSTALPAIPTITMPVNAREIPSVSIAGPSASTNQSETNAAPTPAAASSPTATRNGSGCGRRLLERGLGWPGRAQVAPEPHRVHAEQRDRAERGDRDRVAARGVVDLVRDPDEHDDEHREQEERCRVVRQARAEAHDPVARVPAARDDRQPEHEQRVREQRAEHGRRRDDDLARREREEDDEELGQVAERRLENARGRRAEARADRLGRRRRRRTRARRARARETTKRSTASASAKWRAPAMAAATNGAPRIARAH